MSNPTEIHKKALRVLDEALASEDWKERLTAARIVVSKVNADDEDADVDLDIYDAAMRRHDDRQKGREIEEEE